LKKRYSYLIRPLQRTLDLIIINLIFYFIHSIEYFNFYFLAYISAFWLISSYSMHFYEVFRFTRVLGVLNLLARQFFVFILGYFAYFGIFREGEVVNNQFIVLVFVIISISFLKFLWFFLLKRYRSFGNNYRTTVVLGFDQSAKNIIKLFKSKSNLGYKYLGFFSNRKHNIKEYLGNLADVLKYTNENEVDEIYCSLKELTKEEIKIISKFATDQSITLKLIPDSIELYSKNQSVQYYDDALMVLNVNRLPFEFAENFYIKRIFDIIFSLVVCFFILSWLIPILWIVVKLESNGPLVFKQKREGIKGEEFVCYKFRSMRVDELSHKVHVAKNDVRVTIIGAFLRKTSIDELPQFFNVLQGHMSVVGPRPHIESLSLEYQKEVDDYLKRHIVKPGITGLAQVSGYRGEVKKISDIKNRVRLDVFYIENWSFLLDLKIVFKTALNVFKGDENAY
jgi:putative colanic acid biosynthesis UDP-glucose lipid carrier transferase